MDLLSPETLESLADAGPAGVILILAILVVLFMRGNIRRGREVEEWKEIAHKAVQQVEDIVPTVESLAETVEAMYDAQEACRKEAELRRLIESERRHEDT